MGRFLRDTRAARRRSLPVHSFPQLFVPLSALDALDLALQLVQVFLLSSDLADDLGAPCPVQLLEQLGHKVLVLQRFLYTGQRRSCGLPLPRVLAILGIAVAVLFQLDLPPQTF